MCVCVWPRLRDIDTVGGARPGRDDSCCCLMEGGGGGGDRSTKTKKNWIGGKTTHGQRTHARNAQASSTANTHTPARRELNTLTRTRVASTRHIESDVRVRVYMFMCCIIMCIWRERARACVCVNFRVSGHNPWPVPRSRLPVCAYAAVESLTDRLFLFIFKRGNLTVEIFY